MAPNGMQPPVPLPTDLSAAVGPSENSYNETQTSFSSQGDYRGSAGAANGQVTSSYQHSALNSGALPPNQAPNVFPQSPPPVTAPVVPPPQVGGTFSESQGRTSRAHEPHIIRRKLNGFVGFSNLPQQWHQRSIRKGFSLNAMVVGASGLGKTTLLNTLFEIPVQSQDASAVTEFPHTVSIEPTSFDLEENGVHLRLTIIDTPGFGDAIDNVDSWKPIVEEIDRRYDEYLEAENAVNRSTITDNRIHVCLYFIAPTGHSLRPLDIVVMMKLHKKVNLIPVISKADTLTDEELAVFKQAILADIKYQNIEIFEPPRYENDDEETLAETAEMMSRVPFAVVGSTQYVQTIDGRTVRGRAYPWGVIEVENENHSDFTKLRNLLVRSNLEDLRERTADTLYENYRTEKMLSMGIQQDPSVFREVDPVLRQEEERKHHEERLAKMEEEMRSVFQQKVTEKEMKLKNSEKELFTKHREIKEQLERQRAELEATKTRLEQTAAATDDKKGRKGFSLR